MSAVEKKKSRVNIQKQSGYSRRQPFEGSVPRIDNHLSSKLEGRWFIKPGADLERIVGKTILGSSRLSNKGVLVCNGGGNDVYNSNSKKVIHYYRLWSFSRTMINQT